MVVRFEFLPQVRMIVGAVFPLVFVVVLVVTAGMGMFVLMHMFVGVSMGMFVLMRMRRLTMLMLVFMSVCVFMPMLVGMLALHSVFASAVYLTASSAIVLRFGLNRMLM